MWRTEKLRPAAKKQGINFKTAFRWRYKLLTQPTKARAHPLVAMIKADETSIN
jgi:hypothetical protein